MIISSFILVGRESFLESENKPAESDGLCSADISCDKPIKKAASRCSQNYIRPKDFFSDKHVNFDYNFMTLSPVKYEWGFITASIPPAFKGIWIDVIVSLQDCGPLFVVPSASKDLLSSYQMLNLLNNTVYVVPPKDQEFSMLLVFVEQCNARKNNGSFMFEITTNLNRRFKVISMRWKYTVAMSGSTASYSIDLPGRLVNATMFPSYNSACFSIKVHWLHDNHKGYSPHVKKPVQHSLLKPHNTPFEFYFKISSSADITEHYILFLKTFSGNYTHFLVSWNDASRLCGSVGGFLPILIDKDELNQFLSLLKFSMPPLQAVFIGLVHMVSVLSQ